MTVPEGREGHAPVAAPIPERPALAFDVELVGPMRETGFTDPQWLVRREDRFFQVTELLYDLLREIDGRRTLGEIAANLTNKTAWMVGPEHVSRMLRTKLLPLGLLATAPGGVAPGADRRGRSLLQLRMRRNLVGPRVLEPVTALLHVLYAPLLVTPLLLLSAVAYGWFYLAHGIAESVRAALYTPGGLLVTLAMTVLAGAFHELGHAAALRRGGGKVRGIGVGLYLVYPAFYTDVTDAYRLGRAARLRTDLGGIYFHLLFGLLVIGLYLVSGLEVLLAVVLVITADILYQFVPFARLDGYWALADLTGIPDLFSHVAPFLKSLVPASRRPPGPVSRLRPWAKVIFAAYVGLTIPVLAVFGLLLFRGVPRFFMTSLDSLRYQERVFAIALGSGDLVTMAAVGSQAMLLALSIVATVYVMATLSRTPLRALWNWSRPTARRRVLGALMGAGAVGLVIVMWAPDLPFRTSRLPGVQTFTVAERLHVDAPVSYEQTPPVGGPHAPLWHNCGFYDRPITNETGVHSLEHGAVWITYRPELDLAGIGRLRELARSQPYVLVSPFAGLPSPVVASAWGHQVSLDSASDPRLLQFVRAYRLGPQAPERGGPCRGGVGRPAPP
jgi:putative peptide zinc metalloprotease protein